MCTLNHHSVTTFIIRIHRVFALIAIVSLGVSCNDREPAPVRAPSQTETPRAADVPKGADPDVVRVYLGEDV